jgi:hypothetical protein
MGGAQTRWPILNLDRLEDWDHLDALCLGWLTQRAKGQLREYLGESVRGILVEREYVDKDYRDTFYNYYSKKFADYPHKTIRLHFFASRLEPDDLWNLEGKQGDYIGFVVVRPTRVTCVGRTLLNPKKVPGVRGEMPLARYRANVLGHRLAVRAFPAIRQDSDVTICAHAACWMIFRYFSRKYGYTEAYPYQITQMTGDVSHGRLVPSLLGINIGQVCEIFARFGLYPEYFDRGLCSGDEEFERLLYTYIESGLPVVAGLPRHAVTLFGHVSDYRAAPSTRGFTYSSAYLQGLIGNDDNELPYQVFPVAATDTGCPGHLVNRKRMADVDSFVVPLHEKMFLSASRLFPLVEELVLRSPIGFSALNECASVDELVFRVFLTSSRSFKRSSRGRILPEAVARVLLEEPMPKFVWVCELSTKAAYPDGLAFGEAVFDATASDRDRFSFIVIHYPQCLIVNDRSATEDGPERFMGPMALGGPEFYPVYRHNLESVP